MVRQGARRAHDLKDDIANAKKSIEKRCSSAEQQTMGNSSPTPPESDRSEASSIISTEHQTMDIFPLEDSSRKRKAEEISKETTKDTC